MSNPADLPLYLAVYKQLKYFYILIKPFPKSYKYTLGQSILALTWEILDGVIEANSLPNNEKARVLIKSSVSFDKLKVRLRLSHELMLINDRRYAFVIGENEKIGKMLSGWLQWAEKS
jgi:hypothetical protein